MLKLFYSTCPPCNAQADALQALYEDWGEGDDDVQFIGVSNKTWETNQTAATYTNAHGITFPTISVSGGSIPVVNAYLNGGFGGFFGTPTYIVISPEGAVQWDVDFANLNAALASTGAVKPGTSGIRNPDNEHNLWIAPNPSSDFLNIHAKARPSDNTTITIYNILGRHLYTLKPGLQDQTVLHREDVSNWIPGTYLVRIENNGAVLKTMRFVRR